MYKMTNVTKIRDLQYRLLHKRLPANKELHRWKIKSSSKCDFCEQEDSIVHLLFECVRIRELWKQWEVYIASEYAVNVIVDMNAIVTNYFLGKPTSIIMIYRCKCQGEKISYNMYVAEVKYVHSIELYNARVQDKTVIHYKKWGSPQTDNQSIANYVLQYVDRM